MASTHATHPTRQGWSSWITHPAARTLAGAMALAVVLAPGCATPDPLTPPRQLLSPYATQGAEPIWAVVPLRNESGTTAADRFATSDRLVATITQAQGLRALPLNRTIDAMASLEMAEPSGPEDLDRLARLLGADGVIVGSITAYDPYEPQLGIALALYARPGALSDAAAEPLDTRRLVEQPTDYDFFRQVEAGRRPASSVAYVFDGRDHDVQQRVRRFAEGRSAEPSALGWRTYLKSMPDFERFAVWEATEGLLEREWIRLASAAG
ncbi:MAG: hypothetical protein AAFX79_02505 [Planctomycetota bacterium]